MSLCNQLIKFLSTIRTNVNNSKCPRKINKLNHCFKIMPSVTIITSTGYGQPSSVGCCFHHAPLSVRCLVPTWTRPQGGRVHYTHAAAEASYDRERSLAL